ncbi:MAG TPA: hypothetical protein VFR43_02980, partial [Gaiellaceae bacterium]|nr:hypothetical protein [Gaiellaceae bacterium]
MDCRMHAWIRALVVAALAVAAAVAGGGAATARAAESPACPSSTDGAYALALVALTGPKGADLALAVTAASGCEQAASLKKVQLKIYAADRSLADVRNLKDVPAPGGAADVDLGPLERGRLVEAEVLVQTGAPPRTYVLRGEAVTRLRPDLVVEAVNAPAQTLTTRPVDLYADVAELNGDTGAHARVSLLWGPSLLGTADVTVPAGGRATVSFEDVPLTQPARLELSVRVGEAAPGETDATNNDRTATVDVTALELARSRLLLPSLGGYGAQFDQHVYARITAPPPATLPDFEAKAKALEPQLVRIFFQEVQERVADNMQSFVETVQLAQEAGATINITYQTAANAKTKPDQFMGQFAAVLDDLVRTRGFSNVRWVTIQNEPNDTLVTLTQYEALYRALDAHLVARGLRDQIGLMGGDLVAQGDVPGQPNPGQRAWFQYMAAEMNDVLDSYSVHIYWNYWDIEQMEHRLRDVRQIVTEELPADARKPLYVTEFGVRGIRNLPGKPTAPHPGFWEDGTPLARTNIAAFQQLWFNVLAAQLGYEGTVKWDAYWGKYDPSYVQSHYLIGPAEEGWPLFPAYHAFRLLLQTTARGWQVLGVDPWASDDWVDEVTDQEEQEVAAYAGPDGELTLVGLDTHARGLNAGSAEVVPYSVGGLPPSTELGLALWNADASGQNSLAGTVTTSAAGVA